MTITIKDLNGTQLLSEEFVALNIENDIYSITFSTSNTIQATFQQGGIYNVTFLESENLGISGTFLMSYQSYHYSASTAIMLNEAGEKITTVQVNSNSLQMKKI